MTCPIKSLPEWLELERVLPNLAYTIWDATEGRGLEKAPNGEPSKLYGDLMLRYKNDSDKAMLVKNAVTNKDTKLQSGESTLLDDNGEIIASELELIDDNANEYKDDKVMYADDTVNSEVYEDLKHMTSTPDVILYLLDKGYIPQEYVELVNLLKTKSAKIRFAYLAKKSSTLLGQYSSTDGIMVYPSTFNGAIDDLVSTVLHELIHQHTVEMLRNPETKFEIEFKAHMEEAFKLYKSLETDSELYGFSSTEEFVSELLSSLAFRDHLKTLLPSLYTRVLEAIKSLLKGLKMRNTSISSVSNAITKAIEYDINLDRKQSSSEYVYNKQSQTLVDELNKLRDLIIAGLKLRLKAVLRYAIGKNRASTEYAIKLLIDEIGLVDSITAVSEFVQHLNDNVANITMFINSPMDDINSKQLILMKRDYLGYYGPMLLTILSLTENSNVLEDLPDYEMFKENVQNLILKFNKIESKYNYVLKHKTRDFLQAYAEESGSPFTGEMIAWLEDPKNDISWLGYYVGMASGVDNEVVRIMENIIRNVNNKVNRNTYTVGKSLLPLLLAAKNKHGSDVMLLLLERNDDGTKSGYFVRDRKYGTALAALNEFYLKLAEKYKLEQDENGKFMPPTDKDKLKAYNKEINKWKSENLERLFTDDYYELRDLMLSEFTKDILDNINLTIFKIKGKYTVDKIFYNHRLTEEDKEMLKSLLILKRLLAMPYDSNGNDKTGEALLIANELTAFNEATKDNVKYKKGDKRFQDAARTMYNVLTKEEYEKWYSFNTHTEYKQEFWDLLEGIQKEELYPEYEELRARRKAILSNYRKDNSMEYDGASVDLETLAKIKELDEAIADMYNSSLDLTQFDEDEDGIVVNGGPEFKDIARVTSTDEYNKLSKEAKEKGGLYYKDWFRNNHYKTLSGKWRQLSIWTKIEPLNSWYVESGVPNAMFSELDANSKYVNKNYDLNGDYFQPKLSKYSNKEQWNKIQNSKELKDLYDELIRVMKASTKSIGFLQHTDPYRLPLITARKFLMIAKGSSLLKGLKYTINDSLGIKDDDKDYVELSDVAPDGTLIHNIPTRYLKMLDDPNMITNDVVGSVIEFYSMSENFKLMSAVLDDLDMILTRVALLNVKHDGKITSSESNVFKKAKLLVDMHVYGLKKLRLSVKIFGKKIELSKGLGLLYVYTSVVNLAYNLWAIGTNAITGLTYTDIESILGRYYSLDDILFAKAQLLKNMPDNIKNLGNVNVKNKLMGLMLRNQVTRSNLETFARLDNSAAIRAINLHFWYNGYTAGDFCVKSLVLASVYHSYRLVTIDGKPLFVTEALFILKLYSNDRVKGKMLFKLLHTTLYDAYNESGLLLDLYKEIVNEKLENKVTNKIHTLALKIDGNLSDTDRSAIHANAFALFLVMHRNFMIVGILDRFKGRLFNYNTGMVEEGMYVSTSRFAAKEISTIFSNISHGKLTALRQIMADYNNLLDYEKYNVKKVMIEMGNLISWGLIVSMLLVPLADSGDGEDDWFMEAFTYMAMRSAFEFRTLYNPFELLALLNSPSAAFNTIEYMSDMFKLLWLPNYFDNNLFKKIDRGAYEGIPKVLRNVIKFTPGKNIIEVTNPKTKRSFLQNQLMM